MTQAWTQRDSERMTQGRMENKMKANQVKTGMRVRMIVDGGMAARGDTGVVTELRGWNYDLGNKKDSRWVVVLIDIRANGQPSKRGLTCTTNEIERV